MEMIKSKSGDVLTVELHGRLDTLTSPELEEAIIGELKSVKVFVMDCVGLKYISSAGLRVILEARQAMEESGGEMKLKNVNDAVMEILEFTGFLDFLTVE